MTRCQAIEQAAIAVVARYDNDNCRLHAMGWVAIGRADPNPLDDLIDALAKPKRRQQKGRLPEEEKTL